MHAEPQSVNRGESRPAPRRIPLFYPVLLSLSHLPPRTSSETPPPAPRPPHSHSLHVWPATEALGTRMDSRRPVRRERLLPGYNSASHVTHDVRSGPSLGKGRGRVLVPVQPSSGSRQAPSRVDLDRPTVQHIGGQRGKPASSTDARPNPDTSIRGCACTEAHVGAADTVLGRRGAVPQSPGLWGAGGGTLLGPCCCGSGHHCPSAPARPLGAEGQWVSHVW